MDILDFEGELVHTIPDGRHLQHDDVINYTLANGTRVKIDPGCSFHVDPTTDPLTVSLAWFRERDFSQTSALVNQEVVQYQDGQVMARYAIHSAHYPLPKYLCLAGRQMAYVVLSSQGAEVCYVADVSQDEIEVIHIETEYPQEILVDDICSTRAGTYLLISKPGRLGVYEVNSQTWTWWETESPSVFRSPGCFHQATDQTYVLVFDDTAEDLLIGIYTLSLDEVDTIRVRLPEPAYSQVSYRNGLLVISYEDTSGAIYYYI